MQPRAELAAVRMHSPSSREAYNRGASSAKMIPKIENGQISYVNLRKSRRQRAHEFLAMGDAKPGFIEHSTAYDGDRAHILSFFTQAPRPPHGGIIPRCCPAAPAPRLHLARLHHIAS